MAAFSYAFVPSRQTLPIPQILHLNSKLARPLPRRLQAEACLSPNDPTHLQPILNCREKVQVPHSPPIFYKLQLNCSVPLLPSPIFQHMSVITAI